MLHLVGFMLGRFFSAGAMKYVSAPRLLALFAVGGMAAAGVAVGGTGMLAVWMVVLLGFFNSMMFPTIFALSLEGLGPHRKLGASLLVMSIVGGAVLPALMGLVSDRHTIQTAFVVPILCYAYVFYFAVRGHRPTMAGPNRVPATA